MRILFSLLLLSASTATLAQNAADSAAKPKAPKFDYTKLNLKNRANDHLLIQYGYDGWAGTPDSIRTTGFGRHFNLYVMLDKPFKTDPRWSVGLGVGVGSSNIFFEKTDISLVRTSANSPVAFRNVADTNHFKKYKLTNVWAEAPVEIRYTFNPANANKSWKIALGAKVGTMIAGFTKGKNLQTRNGESIFGNRYIEKTKERGFFQNTRLSATLRVGYGAFSLHAAYQITNHFKDGLGPAVRPYSIGLTISGL